MLAVVLTEVAHVLTQSGATLFRFTPLVALGAFLALVVTFPLISKLLLRRLNWRGRNAYERIIALSLLLVLAVMATVPILILILIDQAIRLSWEDAKEWLACEASHAFEIDDPAHWLLPLGLIIGLIHGRWRIADDESAQVLLLSLDADEHHYRLVHDFAEELSRGWFSPGLRHEFETRDLPRSERMQISPTPGGWQIADPASGRRYVVRNEGDRLSFVDMESDLWDDGDQGFVLAGLGLLPRPRSAATKTTTCSTTSHGTRPSRTSRPATSSSPRTSSKPTGRSATMPPNTSAPPSPPPAATTRPTASCAG